MAKISKFSPVYQQTLDYLYSQLPMFHRIGAAAYKANLKNTRALCRLLGNPESKFKSVHIAGSNGKGSTAHMLAGILQTAGYKTGLYTSPHLIDFRERIRINGKMIPEKEVTAFVRKHKKAFEKIRPSFFEWTVALCFDYFAREKVDIAIIETGLGGRLDSTNVITPILSIITNIGWDHTDLLGDTLEKIAVEKAGIIKPKVPVIIGEEDAHIRKILIQHACKNKSKFYLPKVGCRIRTKIADMNENKYEITLPNKSWYLIPPLDLKGYYQKKNLAPVVQAAWMLNRMGFKIPLISVGHGISHAKEITQLRGRWEKIGDSPLTICDVGHNKDGIREVVKQIKLTPHDHLHFVLGFVNDKDVSGMLKLLPKNATYYFCKANLPRGMDAEELKQKAENYKRIGVAYPSVIKAFSTARKSAGKNDLVFVGGSTFVVAEVL